MQPYWDSEEIFVDGDEYFDRLIQDIESAKNYITLEMYIFRDDILGKKITSHLINAHQRGVKIQIIVDGLGSHAFIYKLHGIFLKKGILVKLYNPLPFYHPYYGKISFLKKFQLFGVRIWRLNKRNHRKIITIDQKIMFSGSFNITAEHTKFHTDKPWKDMGVRVTGDNVKFAVMNFKKSWKLRDYFRYKKQMKKWLKTNWRESPLQLDQTVFMKRYYYKNLLQKIHEARDRIWLMTPYFIPKRRLIRVLCKAAKRGVDVRLLIAGKTDVEPFRWLQYFYYPYLIKNGVKISQYTDSILHAKNYIIDDWMTIGTSNLNHRSFLHDLEVDLVIQDEENRKKVAEHFIQCSETQQLITEEDLASRPFWDRVLSRIFFLFKYWF